MVVSALVIPAKAGTHKQYIPNEWRPFLYIIANHLPLLKKFFVSMAFWVPAFAGMTRCG